MNAAPALAKNAPANGADQDGVLALFGEDTTLARVETAAVAVLNRSEIEAQLDAAHRHPRSLKTFANDALAMATLTKEVAESCIYALPRGGKPITGPSVRFAEIVASAYGNLHIGARQLDADDKTIGAQGIAWDLQKNVRVTVEARRRITNKDGERYNDDMINVTGAAAASIALRNAIFRVVPRAYVDAIFARVRKVAVGDATTLDAHRAEIVTRLEKIGVPRERVFARLERKGIEDVTLEDLEVLIGFGTAIKAGERTIDECFPPVGGEVKTSAATKALEDSLRAGGRKKTKPGAKEAPAPAASPAQAAAAPTEPAPPPTPTKAPDQASGELSAEEQAQLEGRQPGEDG